MANGGYWRVEQQEAGADIDVIALRKGRAPCQLTTTSLMSSDANACRYSNPREHTAPSGQNWAWKCRSAVNTLCRMAGACLGISRWLGGPPSEAPAGRSTIIRFAVDGMRANPAIWAEAADVESLF